MEDILNGYVLQVVIFVCINIILAMTIYMTLCTGLLSLGNAGFMSLGAYTSAILTVQYNLPMPLGILAGGVVAMIVGLIIGLPTTRLRGLYLAIATLGFGEVVRVIALNLDITHWDSPEFLPWPTAFLIWQATWASPMHYPWIHKLWDLCLCVLF